MHKAAMKRCCMALALLAFSCNFSEGFVAVGQSRPRARLTEGDTQRDMIRAASKVGAPSSPLSPQSRRRRGRGSGNQQEGRSVGGGVGSLRIDMGTNMPGVELVAGFLDSPMATILEQSARHHYPSAFIGGTVGVLGTLTAIKIKINQVKELTACPYCRSTGQLPCATCYGVGSVTIPDMDTATAASIGSSSSGVVTTTTLTCPSCRGKTFISCVNCKGDGRGVPLFLNKKVSRDPESEIEDVGYA